MKQKNQLIIHTEHIISNYKLIKEHFSSDNPLYAVVKSNAYGHGLSRVVKALHSVGHRHFAVFHMKEALRLRTLFRNIRILVMGDTPYQHIEAVMENDIEIGIFSRQKWKELLQKGLSDAHLHIKLETGMNRMGIERIDDKDFRNLINSSQKANCSISFYTHLSAAPRGENKSRVDEQYSRFSQRIEYLKSEVADIRHIHFFNSANLPFHTQRKAHQPYGARIGLLLYGYSTLRDKTSFPWLHNLKPAMELHSWIMQIKTIRKGEFIGYGLKFQCEEDKRIGFVPIGYADGYTRALTNVGKVLTEHGFASVVGAVNMNLIAIDLSEYEKININDPIIIIGSNEHGSLTASDHAEAAGTIEYEILTSIGNQEIWENYE